MVDQAVVDSVYRLLLITGMGIILILLFNNFIFYHRKLKDSISLMLICAFLMGAFELFWEYVEGHPDLIWLTYMAAILYNTSFILFASIFNYFFLQLLNHTPKKKWVLWLIYGLPNIAFFILDVTTPWTGLVFTVNKETGFLNEESLYLSLFYIIVWAYFITALVVTIVHATKHWGDKNQFVKKLTFMLIGFDIIAPLSWLIQLAILGPSSDYVAISLVIALALAFLISNLNTLLLEESEDKIRVVEADLKIASNIQNDALPPANPEFNDKYPLTLRASMDTAKEVGGDFYDYFPINEQKVCFLMADVSGKGTPAALFMMNAKTVIKDHASIYDDTGKIFTLSNNRLNEGNKATMFATAWIAILNKDDMTIQYTNAGHTYPLLYRKGKGAEYMKKVDGLFLGVMAGIPYQSNIIKVEEGDRLFLYTDGVTEAHNIKDELYGEERLLNLFNDNIDKSDDEIIDIILKDVKAFTGEAPQFDDITMMIVTIK